MTSSISSVTGVVDAYQLPVEPPTMPPARTEHLPEKAARIAHFAAKVHHQLAEEHGVHLNARQTVRLLQKIDARDGVEDFPPEMLVQSLRLAAHIHYQMSLRDTQSEENGSALPGVTMESI